MTWQPATIDEVLALLAEELRELHPRHQAELSPCLIKPRLVPVDEKPGETVVVVAEIDGDILYWSDIEEGWELETPSPSGGVPRRGCNQFELSHVTHHLSRKELLFCLEPCPHI